MVDGTGQGRTLPVGKGAAALSRVGSCKERVHRLEGRGSKEGCDVGLVFLLFLLLCK